MASERSKEGYGLLKEVSYPYERAVEKVTEELKKEGFGILTTIDVRETLKKKLNVDFQKYVILGACNPSFAHRALQSEEQIGLLLPCNVIVYDTGGKTNVGAFDPMAMMSLSDNKELASIAAEVRLRLERVVAAL